METRNQCVTKSAQPQRSGVLEQRNTLFTLVGANSRPGDFAMAELKAVPDQGKVERRRAARIALHLDATMRDGNRKAPARVLDMSTHGCRIECSTVVADDSFVFLAIDGLQSQRARVAWHCEEFIGLEFETALSEPVFDRLLASQQQLPDKAIRDLRSIASRTQWLARQAGEDDIAILADISRQCAEHAVVEGLRRGQGKAAPPKGE